MTLMARKSEEYLELVDHNKGLVDRSIFSDRDIYEMELERIFARSWSFMAHASQIPNPGDFFMTRIGEDRVIVVRDNDGNPQTLVNSCRHRGNAICRAEEGHATSFMCTYHGWTYDLKGALVGVPGFKEVYHEELDRENWGLIKARTESYHGFIFANLDPEAPDLDEYLGDIGRISIDQLTARGNLTCAPGIQKWVIDCNWKFAVDNVWDFYHPNITHASSRMVGWGGVRSRSWTDPILWMLGDYGHVIGETALTEEQFEPDHFLRDNSWRKQEGVREKLTPAGQRSFGHPHIFPNLWIGPRWAQVGLGMLMGPTKTEVWWFSFVYDFQDEEQRSEILLRSVRHNGPGGMFELDDGENWGESTHGAAGTISGRFPLNYSMNVGKGEVTFDEASPPHIDSLIAEHGQLWYYRSWSRWMAAESWAELKATQPSFEDGYV